MSANDFYLDMEDVEELDEATIIARADAQAWNPDEDEFISIKEVDYDIKKENGKYPVTFSTAAGTSVTVNMIVKDENRVTSTENEEEIYAMNFFKKVDEIQEAVALDTDLKTWPNASAWSLEDDTAVEITDVKYDFDPETITPGIYDVTFATKGYEYKIDTTDKFEVGDEVYEAFRTENFPMEYISVWKPETHKYHIDLWAANRLQLSDFGVPPRQIENAGICTYRQHEDFFSARRLGIKSGRILSGIMLNGQEKEERK